MYKKSNFFNLYDVAFAICFMMVFSIFYWERCFSCCLEITGSRMDCISSLALSWRRYSCRLEVVMQDQWGIFMMQKSKLNCYEIWSRSSKGAPKANGVRQRSMQI